MTTRDIITATKNGLSVETISAQFGVSAALVNHILASPLVWSATHGSLAKREKENRVGEATSGGAGMARDSTTCRSEGQTRNTR